MVLHQPKPTAQVIRGRKVIEAEVSLLLEAKKKITHLSVPV
jgi:hypothetical protein